MFISRNTGDPVYALWFGVAVSRVVTASAVLTPPVSMKKHMKNPSALPVRYLERACVFFFALALFGIAWCLPARALAQSAAPAAAPDLREDGSNIGTGPHFPARASVGGGSG